MPSPSFGELLLLLRASFAPISAAARALALGPPGPEKTAGDEMGVVSSEANAREAITRRPAWTLKDKTPESVPGGLLLLFPPEPILRTKSPSS